MGPGSRLVAALAFAGAIAVPAGALARGNRLELDFDRVLGTRPVAAKAVSATARADAVAAPAGAAAQPRQRVAVQRFVPPRPVSGGPFGGYATALDARLAALAAPGAGRIGVAALDLSSGRMLSVLGDQPFPLASTSKVAIAATFLAGVDKGRWRLDDRFPLLIPVRSARFAGATAPVRRGPAMSARNLIEIAITHSDNHAADALLAVVGGPQAVNRWLRGAGITGMRMDRDIATLVRDDGEFNPATTIDPRDSGTPGAMVNLLGGLYRGEWLSPSSRAVLLGAMARTVTGRHRMRALLPEDASVAHKTGTLAGTSSDVGVIKTPDGRSIAVAIYVTGQGGRAGRDACIAAIARAIYDGYQEEAATPRRLAAAAR